MEFLFLETSDCLISAEIVADSSKHVKANKLSFSDSTAAIKSIADRTPAETIIFAPAALRENAAASAALQAFSERGHVLWIQSPDPHDSSIDLKDLSSEAVLRVLTRLFDENRSIGIKCFLEKGSKIYSETLFDTGVLGAKLDPCHKLARKRLGAASALKAWAAVEAVILAAFQNLPGFGEGTTGERVDLQIGSDESILAVGIRFDLTKDSLLPLLSDPGLQVARDQSHLIEIREIHDAKKIEVNLTFFRAKTPASPVRIVHTTQTAALEKAEDAAAYGFSPMDSLNKNEDAEPVTKTERGFKKKFSEQVQVIAAGRREAEQTPTSNSAKPANTKSLEAKIIELQETLRERTNVVHRLSKDLEEIKDPMKIGVISNIKDAQKQGLADRIEVLKKELAASERREKEFMALADKAVQMREEAMKKIKELELKVRQASGGNNSKVLQLERKLEEAARQRKEMSARISQLIEQLNGKAA